MAATQYPNYPSRGGVAGGGYQEPGFAILSGATMPSSPTSYITDPSRWYIKWENPKYEFSSPDAQRTRTVYADKFRFTMTVNFDYIDEDIREDIIDLINHSANGDGDRLIRVWPHKDATTVYYDCFISDESVDQYLAGSPVGYQNLVLRFVASTTVNAKPKYTTPKYFTDTDVEDPGSNYAYFYDSDVEEDDDYETYFYDPDIQQ